MRYIVCFFLLIHALSAESSTTDIQTTFKYCTHSGKIDLNPFRKIEDPYDLSYLLLLTKSYISEDSSEKGILGKWTFSMNGKVLRAKINEGIVWQDGAKLGAQDAAIGIALGFEFREIGKKVRVRGIEKFKIDKLNIGDVEGISIISPDEFELKFESEIDNLTGVIREAISTNSRHNRVWPIRIFSKYESFDLIGKHQVHVFNGVYAVFYEKYRVELLAKNNCDDADFYPVALPKNYSSNDFSHKSSLNPQSLVGFLKKRSKNITNANQRKSVSRLLRFAVADFSKKHPDQIVSVNSHFEKGEPGYMPDQRWEQSPPDGNGLPKSLSIGTYLPKTHPVVTAITEMAEKQKVAIYWEQANSTTADLLLVSSRVSGGRQIWLQDSDSFKMYGAFLENQPLTKKALERIKISSSATLPTKVEDLKQFESAAILEYSVVPVGRINLNFFTKKSLPIEVVTTDFDELKFSRRK